jgi:4,5-DOPA dioxygenase extradiol
MNLPTLFVSHGAPTFALQPGVAGRALQALGTHLPRAQAVLVVSPHWHTAGLEVMTHPQPPTLHDFGGFPEALYALRYPAAGQPQLAEQVLAHLAQAGLPARANAQRGLDHGAWVPLRHLYPAADVPVVQLSLPMTDSVEVMLEFGRALHPLRASGVLILASGSLTHNLGDLRSGDNAHGSYASHFMAWVASTLAAGDLEALCDYRRQAPDARRAHPTEEHWQPLFIAIGAAGDDWTHSVRLPGGLTYGVIGMDAYGFAVSPALQPAFEAARTAAGVHARHESVGAPSRVSAGSAVPPSAHDAIT